jgi:hypothetical protein
MEYMTSPPLQSNSPPAADATLGRIIVYERCGQWAIAMRRDLQGAGVDIVETRSLGHCRQALSAAPGSFLVAEMTPSNVESVFRLAASLTREFPLARLAVVTSPGLAPYEWLLREAGAVHCVSSPRHIAPLAQIALRHLASLPPPQQTLVERIWSSLPWGDGRGEGKKG